MKVGSDNRFITTGSINKPTLIYRLLSPLVKPNVCDNKLIVDDSYEISNTRGEYIVAVSGVRPTTHGGTIVSGVRGEDFECDFCITQQGKLMGLLKQPFLPLGEAHMLSRSALDLS